ncbi:MAG: LysM peptidoglycan-binding domain-containing protein, partial [Chloroflexi bacterium]|nr:LysM peptidoglycan-binding domain-containing protein [Chloroflexota bacterium]
MEEANMMSGKYRVPRFQKGRAVVMCVWLGIALLAAGCARFTYNETPTAVPYIAPSPTSLPTEESAAPTLAPTPTLTPIPEGPTMLRTNPSTIDIGIGETALVEVWLDNAEQLHSIELHIGFDPGYVRVEDADPNTEGTQISAGVMPVPAQVIQNKVDNESGLILYHVAKEPASIASRSGRVASFTVRAVAEGGSPLRFNVVNLLDAEEQPLPTAEQIDGLVIVGVGDGAPEPTSEPAPATATPSAGTPAPSPVPISPSTATGVYYTVQPGENLYRISLRYGTTVDAIVAANNLPDRSS